MTKVFDWVEYDFANDGWSKTRENHSDAFDSFVKNLRSYLKEQAGLWYLQALPFKQNWFETSGFIKNLRSGKLAYWNIPDVRYFPDNWRTDILYRTAKHEKDYSGGCNHFCVLEDLMENIELITR